MGLILVQAVEAQEIDGEFFDLVVAVGGGGDDGSATLYLPPGIDAMPLGDDYAVVVPEAESGTRAAVGFADSKNKSKAGPGEFRIVARDSSGAEVVEIWLKADGSTRVKNSAGFFELKQTGQFNANNNFTVDP